MNTLLIVTVIICIGSIASNIGLVWVVIKLYTEILKGLHFQAVSKSKETG